MKSQHKNLITTSLLLLGFGIGGLVFAQGKQAIVILRAGNAAPAACDGGAELNYQTVYDLRFSNKDEIRLLDSAVVGVRPSDATYISRKAYEDSPKGKLVNMYQVKWHKGLLYVLTSGGQTPFLVLPEDMKPPKNSETAMSSFYSVMLSGEAREGKQKRKISMPLRDFWKIYFIPDGGSVNDILFAHAQEEKSVVVWDAFLQKTSNYRADEANNNMRDALLGCVRSSLDQFVNGNYKSLDIAKERTERAQSVRSDEVTSKLLSEIGQHKKRISDIREQFFQLVTTGRWDDAITAAEPIKIYLSTWDELNSLYVKSLDESHKLHLSKGKQALDANQLDVAKTECTLAWQRHPDSADARACVCSSRNRVALRDSSAFRQRKLPRQAKELLEAQQADSDCVRDEAVAKELGLANCEYSQQLFDEALKLTGGGTVTAVPAKSGRRTASTTAAGPAAGGPKPVTALNKKDFSDSRAKLVLAGEMCPKEAVSDLLDKVNRSLASYSVAEAKKAIQRGDSGTAYVYLMTAQNYTPQSENVTILLNHARSQFEEKTQVNIGVVFTDKTGRGDSILNAVTSDIESNATRAGLVRPNILDSRQAANAMRAFQSGASLPSPTAIFFGELLEASLNVNTSDRTVRSSYTEEDPEWKIRDRVHDDRNEQYKNCKKQSGEAACAGLKSQVDELRRHRDSVIRYPRHSYYYYETHFRLTGVARLTFRYVESISRSTRVAETLSAEVADQCVARTGVDSRDGTARNAECNQIQDTSTYASRLSGQLQSDASSRAYGLLRDIPASFYMRAKTSANRAQAVEDYVRFLFLTNDKQSVEAEDAKRFLLAFDTELKTDGVFR
ncbi:MAG: hypothetical protein ACKVQW_15575 [Pyrinomonadaceae bacterium]